MRKLFTACLLLSSINAFAEFTNETAVGLVIIDGNTESSSTTAKQENTYSWKEKNKATARGEYTETEADEVVTAKSWLALARYDRSLTERSGLYASHTWEANRFAGYTQRDTYELGYEYKIIKKEKEKWSSGIGYSQRTTDVAGTDEEVDSPGLALSTKYENSKKEGVTYALDVKYRHDLQDEENDVNHTLDVEPSVSTVLTDILSLKISYLIKSQSNIEPTQTEHTDTTLTTNLVAKF